MHVPHWLQLAIHPLIESTNGCPYCIFIRGVLYGFATATFLGGGLWLMIRP